MWRAFAEHHGVAALPAEPQHVAAFVLARHRAGVSQAGIAANLSAVAWFHERAAEGASSITEAAKATLRAVSRDGTGEPRRPAPVLSVGALLAMAEALPTLGTKFAAKVVRAALPTVKPRQLAELTAGDVEVDPAGRWAVLGLPALGRRGQHRPLAAATVRLEADPGWVGCPVRAVGQLVAAAVDGRLFTQRLLFQEGLGGFDPVTSVDGVPARLLVRDVAIVCVGYCGALRVEELSRARVEDIEPVGDLYRLRLPMTKTSRTMADQAVLLERRGDALDPIRALDRWLAVRGDADGPLFTNLHHRAPGRKTAGDHLPAGNIRVIVQDRAASVGLPSTVSGYSLRRSWATHRYLADPHDLASITMQLRHASMDMTVRYVEDLRPGDLNGYDILSTDQVLASAGGQPVGRKDIGFDPAPLADLVAEATVLSSPQANVAPSTARVNDSLWATWSVWAREQGFSPMPATAEALALFIAARTDKGLKPGSLRAQLRQIVREHATLGYPTLGLASLAEEILDAYSRTHTAGPRKAPVLPIEDLTAMATAAAGLGPGGLRDRVIVCAGYCGAMRLDDMVRARLEDVEATPWGAVLRLRASKDNPMGAAAETVVLLRRNDALDPIAAINDLIAATGSASGPLVPVTLGFDRALKSDSFAYRLEAISQQAGLRVAPTGHSLRRSWATHAYEAGVDLVTIQRHLRHASPTTTKGYIESLSPWVDNAAVRMARPAFPPDEFAEVQREIKR